MKDLEIGKYLKIQVEHYRLGRRRKWETRLVDTFTGETLVIDNDIMSDKPLPISDYANLEGVQRIKDGFEAGKALYLFSTQ